MTMYTVVVSGVSFSLSEASIRSDSPDTNLLAMALLGDFMEAEQRRLVLDRNPVTFKLIKDHLTGYTVFPLGLQDHVGMDQSKFLRYLLDDCDYYGLARLRADVKQQICKNDNIKVSDRDLHEEYSHKIAIHEQHANAIQTAIERLQIIKSTVTGQKKDAPVDSPRYFELGDQLNDLEERSRALQLSLRKLVGTPPAP